MTEDERIERVAKAIHLKATVGNMPFADLVPYGWDHLPEKSKAHVRAIAVEAIGEYEECLQDEIDESFARLGKGSQAT